MLTLGAMCALAFVVLYGARRVGLARQSGAIALVGRLPLEARRSIYLVRVGRRVYVVGASEAGFAKLGELPEAEIPNESQPAAPPFRDVLARVLRSQTGGRRAPTAEDNTESSRPSTEKDDA